MSFLAILGHFKPFLGQIFRQFLFAQIADSTTELVLCMYVYALKVRSSLTSLATEVRNCLFKLERHQLLHQHTPDPCLAVAVNDHHNNHDNHSQSHLPNHHHQHMADP